MEYLVTGAAGFIGSSIARKLVSLGHRVTTIDNLSTGKQSVIPESVEFLEGDCGRAETMSLIANRRFDAIIHMAGQSSGEVSFDDPIYDLNTNTASTLLLLQHARRTGCRKFIYASSMSVYGDHPDKPCCTEEAATVPKSFYAVGKLASENYLRIFSDNFGIDCTAFRFFNVYGIGQNLDNLRQGMASIFLAMAIRNRHVFVKGAKDRFRDFVYIDDVVDAVLKAVENGHGFSLYNVSTCTPTTVECVVEEIKKNLAFDVTVAYGAGTPGDQHGIYGANNKIAEDLNWHPKIDFKTGIKMMMDWAFSLETKHI